MIAGPRGPRGSVPTTGGPSVLVLLAVPALTLMLAGAGVRSSMMAVIVPVVTMTATVLVDGRVTASVGASLPLAREHRGGRGQSVPDRDRPDAGQAPGPEVLQRERLTDPHRP